MWHTEPREEKNPYDVFDQHSSARYLNIGICFAKLKVSAQHLPPN